MLRGRRSALRVRVESGKSLITFKGPVQPAEIKMRDELETVVGDGPLVLTILEASASRSGSGIRSTARSSPSTT